jgi:uncharacterized repeat protein (TIGR01451 family)
MPGSADAAVCMTTDRVWGLVGAGETVTVTVGVAQMGAALADGNGFFWTTLYDASGDRPGLSGGDTVTIYHDGDQAASVALRPIAGEINIVDDTVVGAIGGTGFPIDVTVYVGSAEPSLESYSQTVSTDELGGFVADFSGVFDLIAWHDAQVTYEDSGVVEVHKHVYPGNTLLVRPVPWNGVMGTASPDTSVVATLYDTNMTEKASDTVEADATSGWYGWDVLTDVVPSDIVVVEMAGGATLSRTVGPLNLEVDAATDQLSGQAEPNSTVRAVVGELTEHGWRDLNASTIAEPDGDFTIEFGGIVDIMPGQWAGVLVADDEGDDLNLWENTPSVEVHQTWNEVYGRGPSPSPPESEGRVVTLTLDSTTAVYTTEMEWGNQYRFRQDAHGLPDIAPGEVVTVEAEGYPWQGVVEVKTMTVEHDAGADQFSGSVETPGNRVELYGTQFWNWADVGPLYPVGGFFDTVTTASSSFTASPAGFDVRNAVEYDVAHRTVDDNTELIYGQVDYVRLWPQFNGTFGQFGPPGTAYTYTLLSDVGGFKAQLTGMSEEPSGWANWNNFGNTGERMEPGDQLQAESAAGFNQSVRIPDMTIQVDEATDVISGTGPPNVLLYVQVSGDDGQDEGFVPADANGQFAVAVDELQQVQEGDVEQGKMVMVCYLNEDANHICWYHEWLQVRIDANYGHDWVEVETLPFAAINVTVAGKATVSGEADGDGWFRSDDWSWNPDRPDIEPGDVITATGLGLTSTIDPVGTITGVVDMDADTVSGIVHAPFPTVTVRCEVWTWGGAGIETQSVPGDGGEFFCDFGTVDWDLEPGPDVAVRYVEPDGDSVINMAQPVNLFLKVNYGHDWVEGDYEPGHTLWLTVTESDGSTVKATAELQTQEIPWWGGRTGFSTNLDDPWVPGRPDIETGDRVYGRLDNGYTSTVRMGTITGDVDVDNDTIGGNITADWFEDTLYAWCSVWEDGGPWQDFEIDPKGGSYFCDFTGEWDLLPGHDVGVTYQEPDGDQVINVFAYPAPDMTVEKWTPGSDQVAPGGPIVYTIRYRNEGDAVADSVVLTDTLHPDTSYHSDSSGVTPSDNGDSVVWNLGPVEPGEEVEFQLVLNHTAASGATLLNQADIWTENDSEPDDNHAEAEVRVVDEAGNPYVNKHANPDRPDAGGSYIYEIDCGNDGPVAAGPVVLTDTLPANTHVVDWFSENGYGLWTEMSPNGQFVLEAPAIPGHWGDRIILRMEVDSGVPYGTWLTNTVELAFPVGYAWHEHSDARVEGPHWDSLVDKEFGGGVLVPGGWVAYPVHVRNFGNQPTLTWLTDTLPTGTHLAESWIWDGQTREEFPPYSEDGQTVVWNLGQLLPGAWKNVEIRLDIDPGVQSGDELLNCAEIDIDGDEGWPEDNQDCVTDPVRGKGPNLRVYKEHEWQDDNQRLQYRLHVENIGTEWLDNVWFTDTYPVDTTFNDEWWVEHGPHIELDSHDETNRQLIFWAERFEPGETSKIVVKVDLDEPGAPLRTYTNTVEVETPPGDRNPGDNYWEDVAYSGGEVQWVDFDIYRDWFWGCAYDTPITVKTASEQLVIDGSTCWDEAFPEPFLPGDIVTITAGAGALPVVIEIPDPFTAFVSSASDRVWGQIDHLDHEMVDVDLWGFPWKRVQTDDDGNYRATFDDIPGDAEGDVNYRTEIDYADVVFHRRMDRPEQVYLPVVLKNH